MKEKNIKVILGIKKVKGLLKPKSKMKLTEKNFLNLRNLEDFMLYSKDNQKYRILALIKNENLIKD